MGRPIEEILNIYDTNRYWYNLKYAGFNGYEISNDLIIRSLKFKKKHPYGVLIIPKKDLDTDPVYELSDNDNNRINIRLSEIIKLAQQYQYSIPGYPRPTYIIDNSNTRNSCTITSGRRNKQIKANSYNNERFFPKFTIIDE